RLNHSSTNASTAQRTARTILSQLFFSFFFFFGFSPDVASPLLLVAPLAAVTSGGSGNRPWSSASISHRSSSARSFFNAAWSAGLEEDTKLFMHRGSVRV